MSHGGQPGQKYRALAVNSHIWLITKRAKKQDRKLDSSQNLTEISDLDK